MQRNSTGECPVEPAQAFGAVEAHRRFAVSVMIHSSAKTPEIITRPDVLPVLVENIT